MALNYDELAKQYGGINYDELAKKAQGSSRVSSVESTSQAQTEAPQAAPKVDHISKALDIVGEFLKGFGKRTVDKATELGGGLATDQFFPGGSVGSNLAEKYLPESVKSKIPDQVFNPSTVVPDKYKTPTNKAQKAGAVVSDIADFLIPEAVAGRAVKGVELATNATKAERVLALLGKSTKEAAIGGGVTALQTKGDLGESGKVAAVSAAFPVAGAAIKGLGFGAKEVAKHLSSVLSGVPKSAIERAFSDPVAVRNAVRRAAQEGGDAAINRIYDQAIEAVNFLKKTRAEAYQSALGAIKATEPAETSLVKTTLTKPTVIKGIPMQPGETAYIPPKTLTTSGVKSVLTKTLKQFGINTEKGLLNASEAAIDATHAKKLQEIANRVYSWNKTKPTELNTLRQIIDGYEIGGVNLGSSEKKFNAIIGKVSDNLSNYIGKHEPAIPAMKAEYAAQSQVLDGILKDLRVDPDKKAMALRKLLNVFNPKSEVYKPILQQLDQKAGTNLMSDIAGLLMSKWTPEGLGKYLFTSGSAVVGALKPAAIPGIVAGAAASSPHIVGGVAALAGRAAKNATLKTVVSGAKELGKAITRKATQK